MRFALYSLIGDGPFDIAEGLKHLNKSNDKTWIDWIERMSTFDENFSVEPWKSMYQAAGCQVIRHVQDPDLGDEYLFDPRLQLQHTSLDDKVHCPCRTLSRDFDPCEHQIKAPLIYLNGQDDPMTPIKGAHLHEQCQNSAQDKVFLENKNGGHAVLGTFRVAPCVPMIFDAAIKGDLSSLKSNGNYFENCVKGKSKGPPSVVR